MKSYFKYLLLPAFLLGTVACDKDITLNPEQSLTVEAAFANKATAQASLFGVYSATQVLEIFGGLSLILNEYMADNVEFVGSFPTLQEIRNYATLSNNTNVQGLWQQHYFAIMAANTVISRVPGVPDASFTDAEKRQAVAEAKFLRAITYFNLVNLFGQPYNLNGGTSLGVPLVLTPDILDGKDALFPKRNTVGEVYAQIEKDLKEAIPDLPRTYGSADQRRGRATKGAANGMLCRLFLYKNDNAGAIARADSVLNYPSLYALATDFSFYDANSSEDVFTVQMTTTDNSRTGAGGLGGYMLPAARGGRGDCPYSASLLAAFDQTKDLRFTTLSFKGTSALPAAATFTNKYKDGLTNSDNSPVQRVSEIILNKAEALVKSTNTVNADAITLLNRIRTRAGLAARTAADFANSAALLSAILDERRLELCFEGHRRLDLLRNGFALRTTGTTAAISKPGDVRVILPIPQREIDLGSSLPQNNGY